MATELPRTSVVPWSRSIDPVVESRKVEFSIGICASGEATQTLSKLLRVIREEEFPQGFSLSSIIIVASAPSQPTMSLLRGLASEESRIKLIVEPLRRGKIEAVNTIIENRAGSFLVFVNADAVPAPGAIAKLLRRISGDPRVGTVSACPTFQLKQDLNSRILDLMWSIHNASSLELNHMGVSNHASDELMVVRSEALTKIPDDVVNDGAYISGHAFAEGYRILFSEDAKVTIDVPLTVFQLIEQRRRILFGHRQVWRKLGKPPLTLESLMLTNPALSFSLIGRVVSSRPSRIMIVPIALAAEFAAAILSITDRLSSSDRHTVWRRYRERRPGD